MAELRVAITIAQAIDADLDFIEAYCKEPCCISPRADIAGDIDSAQRSAKEDRRPSKSPAGM